MDLYLPTSSAHSLSLLSYQGVAKRVRSGDKMLLVQNGLVYGVGTLANPPCESIHENNDNAFPRLFASHTVLERLQDEVKKYVEEQCKHGYS